MTEKYFRKLRSEELTTGAAIWLHGKSFLDTAPISRVDRNCHSVCGPFLVESVLFGGGHIQEPGVDLVDPATGERRSMMYSWLKVPKEEK